MGSLQCEGWNNAKCDKETQVFLYCSVGMLLRITCSWFLYQYHDVAVQNGKSAVCKNRTLIVHAAVILLHNARSFLLTLIRCSVIISFQQGNL
jgi:hypothetical protein